MVNRLRQLFALTARDRWTLVHAWWLLAVIDLRLRWSPRNRVERALHGSGGRPSEAGAQRESRRLHDLVAVAARHHWVDARCLHRSLVLLQLLHKRRIPARLRIGVRRGQELLEAHAWVELDGRPVGEGEPDFATLEAVASHP